MAVINTNTASLNSQRILNSSQAGLNTSIQRLSSGLRINSAKDDAAGMAISQRMTSQVNGMNQAIRNANDGISLAQTAESAMGSTGDAFQRIRELALQSANASNTKTDRESIQKEVTQLKSEIDRIADQTAFNGNKLLNGDFSSAAFQIGAEAGQTITVNSITDTRTKSIGAVKFAESAVLTVDKDTTIGANFEINGVAIDAVAAGTVDLDQTKKIASAINAKADLTGVYATYDADGSNFKLTSVKADKDIEITGAGATYSADATIDSDAATAVNASDIDVSDFIGSQRAIGIATKALDTINSGRADLGAIQNRFSSVVSNLQVNSENLSAARSRIMDTDFASETANMTRNQILQQAGTAMLAQANQLPNSVMSLLRG